MITADPEETARLEVALSASKNILNHVDRAVQECENRKKLTDLQRRLDTRPIENLIDPVTAQYKVGTVYLDPSTRTGHLSKEASNEIIYSLVLKGNPSE